MDSVDLKQLVLRMVQQDRLPEYEYMRLIELYGVKDPVQEYWDACYPTFGARLAKLFHSCYACTPGIRCLYEFAPVLLQKGLFWVDDLTNPQESDELNGVWVDAIEYIHDSLLAMGEVTFIDVDPWAAAPLSFFCTVPNLHPVVKMQDMNDPIFLHQRVYEFLTIVMKWILSYVVSDQSDQYENRPNQLHHLIDLTVYGNTLVGMVWKNGAAIPVVYTKQLGSSVRIKGANPVNSLDQRSALARP
jgi:hypothetical protein